MKKSVNFFQKHEKHIEYAVITITIIFSIVSCSQSNKALEEAREANKLAIQSNGISHTANAISEGSKALAEQSLRITKETHKDDKQDLRLTRLRQFEDDLKHSDPWNEEVFRKLLAGEQISKIRNLQLFLDPFEPLWESWARGEVYDSDMEKTFGERLRIACNNEQVQEAVINNHNGFKLLCVRFVPSGTIK